MNARGRGRVVNPLTETEVASVLEMRRRGDSKRTIARALNRHESRVAEAIAGANLPSALPRRRGPAALPVPYCLDDLRNSAKPSKKRKQRQTQPAPVATYVQPATTPSARLFPDAVQWWDRCRHGSTRVLCTRCGA